MAETKRQELIGKVVSAKCDKTITVLVETYKNDKLYHKRVKSSKKYTAHDEKNEAKKGDKVLIAATRPLSKRLTKTKITHTNSDRNIGKIAVVISDIDNVLSTGRVKVGADVWSAKSFDSSVIKADSMVEVVGIEGAKLVVKTSE